MESRFRCLVAIPGSSRNVAGALAAARAGGVGLLDLELCSLDDPRVQRNLRDLARQAPPGSWGVRRRPDQAVEAPWTVLTEPPPSHPPLGGRILLEIRDANLLADLDPAGL
ncbi:MAG: hypothetical protein AB1758_09270, partial [Candidatus Eremiobacterota bacterium]